jgi:Uma2 family endonuclease
MASAPDVIDGPLTGEALAERFRELCEDPRFDNLPGKIEIDMWGRILMSPASNYHGMLQMRLGQRLAALGGRAIAEASVITASGLLVADVAWASEAFVRAHESETPFTRAPELCIEIASPSNSRKALRDKVADYLAAGAVEAWIVFAQSKTVEFHGASGELAASRFGIDLAGLFD